MMSLGRMGGDGSEGRAPSWVDPPHTGCRRCRRDGGSQEAGETHKVEKKACGPWDPRVPSKISQPRPQPGPGESHSRPPGGAQLTRAGGDQGEGCRAEAAGRAERRLGAAIYRQRLAEQGSCQNPARLHARTPGWGERPRRAGKSDGAGAPAEPLPPEGEATLS